MNLVNNAIKYNRPGGSLMITTRKVEGKFQVEIKDTGIGMEKVELPSIFDRFQATQ
jgi:signal transduction histidine kinase